MPQQLIDFWSPFDPYGVPPYEHPSDQRALTSIRPDRTTSTIDAFISNPCYFGVRSDKTLHLNLLPVPYGGDLRAADIVLLFLNPRLSFPDYHLETSPAYLKAHGDTIRQSLTGYEFPFIWLDPKLSWHSGYAYWDSRLHHTIKLIADRKFDGVYFKALRDLARRLAVIQLVPYRSLDYPTGLDGQLMSSIAARDCVKRLEAEGRTIIPMRKARDWGSAASWRPNRKAWMTPKTEAGKAILRCYGIDPTS